MGSIGVIIITVLAVGFGHVMKRSYDKEQRRLRDELRRKAANHESHHRNRQ